MQWIGSSKSENRTQQIWESKSRCLPLLLFLYSFLKLLSGNSVESTAYFHLTNTALPLCVYSIYISFDWFMIHILWPQKIESSEEKWVKNSKSVCHWLSYLFLKQISLWLVFLLSFSHILAHHFRLFGS